MTLRRYQSRAEGSLQEQLLLATLGSVRQGLKQLQPSSEVANRFHIGRASQGILACLLQILHRFAIVPSSLKVQRQFGGNLSRLLSIALLFPFPNLLMQALPPSGCQPVVQHVLI